MFPRDGRVAKAFRDANRTSVYSLRVDFTDNANLMPDIYIFPRSPTIGIGGSTAVVDRRARYRGSGSRTSRVRGACAFRPTAVATHNRYSTFFTTFPRGNNTWAGRTFGRRKSLPDCCTRACNVYVGRWRVFYFVLLCVPRARLGYFFFLGKVF